MAGTAIADEFADCTLEDVALAVGYSEPGSADHALALGALLRRLPAGPGSEAALEPGIGHNKPPVHELLEEELAPFRKRRDDLVRVAETAAITDDDSAGKVLDLAQLCKAFEDEVEARRKQLTEPHRQAQKLINDSHNQLRFDVQIARAGMNGVSGLRGLLTTWDDRKKAAAEQARMKAEREAEAKEIAAQSAREQLAKAAESGRGVVSAELTALRLQDEAEHARVEAETIIAQPTRGQLGQVSRRRVIAFDVTDADAVDAWIKSIPELRGHLDFLRIKLVKQHLDGLGVEAVSRGVEIPGVVARVETGAAHVRR